MCSIFRDPRRNDHTIWTAVAPDEVFTVRARTPPDEATGNHPASAQICCRQSANQQATGLQPSQPRSSDKSQDGAAGGVQDAIWYPVGSIRSVGVGSSRSPVGLLAPWTAARG